MTDRELMQQAMDYVRFGNPADPKDQEIRAQLFVALQKRLAQPEQEPRREWVGLTEEEMAELWENRGWYVTIFKAVEAKLKEKNNAD